VLSVLPGLDRDRRHAANRGYRVIAHDRRGHGRSTQTAEDHDMDTYAADVAEVTKALDLKNAVHIGHSTGGGESSLQGR
jgi:non-heme chloroperoxidase